jgi:hypothetical protein
MMPLPGRGSLKPADIMAFRKAVYLVRPKQATCQKQYTQLLQTSKKIFCFFSYQTPQHDYTSLLPKRE